MSVGYRATVERLEEEKRALAEDITEVFKEARSQGFDVKIMREIIRLRRMDKDDLDEREALLSTYMRAIGMLPLFEDREPVPSMEMTKLTAGLAAAAGVEGTIKAIREAEEKFPEAGPVGLAGTEVTITRRKRSAGEPKTFEDCVGDKLESTFREAGATVNVV